MVRKLVLTNSAINESLRFTLNKVFLNCLAPCLNNITRKSVNILSLVLLEKYFKNVVINLLVVMVPQTMPLSVVIP